MKLAACLLLVSLCAAPAAFAQAAPEGSTGRLRVGPVVITPTFALTNIGVDDNVFYQPDSAKPASDFTMTLTPKVVGQMRAGRAQLTGTVKEDLVYYQEFASERSANSNLSAGLKLPLNRVTLAVDGSYVSSRDRPGFEIDARSQHSENAYGGSIEVRALPKVFIGVTGRRATVSFDHGATFLGTSLWSELDRTTTSGGMLVRYRLTPLTSLTLNIEGEADRFAVSHLRDANSVAVMLGLHFEPSALISGSATLGRRTFQTLTGQVAGYDGTVAKIDLSCSALGSTKLGLSIDRDLQYSYDFDLPYYLQTGVRVSATQHVFGPFDLTGRVGVQQLAYRGQTGVAIPLAERTDSVHSVGGTISYRLAKTMGMGFNFDYQTRASIVAQREYSGLRYGTAVTYGF